MSLFEVALARFQATMYQLTVMLSFFEAGILRIPPLVRFFTAESEAHELHLQALMFIVAPLHAFFTMPLLEKLLGKRKLRSWNRHLVRCLGWYLIYFTTFWIVGFVVSFIYEARAPTTLTWLQSRLRGMADPVAIPDRSCNIEHF
jgi:hypothetical protein